MAAAPATFNRQSAIGKGMESPSHFPQSALGDEFAEGDGGLLLVDADPEHVEIAILCLLRHFVLPLASVASERPLASTRRRG